MDQMVTLTAFAVITVADLPLKIGMIYTMVHGAQRKTRKKETWCSTLRRSNTLNLLKSESLHDKFSLFFSSSPPLVIVHCFSKSKHLKWGRLPCWHQVLSAKKTVELETSCPSSQWHKWILEPHHTDCWESTNPSLEWSIYPFVQLAVWAWTKHTFVCSPAKVSPNVKGKHFLLNALFKFISRCVIARPWLWTCDPGIKNCMVFNILAGLSGTLPSHIADHMAAMLAGKTGSGLHLCSDSQIMILKHVFARCVKCPLLPFYISSCSQDAKIKCWQSYWGVKVP